MKIEKGKLYYFPRNGSVFKEEHGGTTYTLDVSDKIAVHCPTKEDWEYVNKIINHSGNYYDIDYCYKVLTDDGLSYNKFYCTKENGYHIITIEEFKKFYPESDNGVKQSSNKLNYELDFDFITQMAERMQTNKGKYDPYNWKKPIEIDGLKQAIFRHVLEIMKGNYEDDGRLMGHLEALSCNAMMLNYQLKK